ncbi:serine/threonine protein kinase with TPR repeats [Desulfotomaculum nigrificans CO-1-SRB]|uniref:Serine/threonine protein kinase with TPR repeats n=1 Tax=Desulfotomaculum nigrificans (strain DSM 14880 / VKM B-2319 / CO-1-SRB) TaxID=868595 RepID=F6B6C6_DESCC|nr:serine/threonine-protein kinase [Desulfotomaculum nigrificans]AEF93197.1 serine/threonine protein kinase with TPR repeats [Desulfotomaculum nigrificans CO-1-SRB]
MKRKAVNFHPQVDMNIGGKYLLKEFIDEGSFGSVWKAVNLENRQTVALKIPKDQERGDNTLAEGKEFIGNHHPNVISIYWMGRVDGVFLIEMEYFNGHKLSDELCEIGFKSPRTFEEIYNLFLQILNGVEYIHSKHICHGDIKPQNILTDGKTAKITDFGTSKLIEDLFIKTIDGGGTWAYMAPEVAGSNRRYLNSDIYALGVLLYKFLTGRTPHETANQLINNMPYPKPREINDNIPESVEKIILKLLKRSPKERYQNVGEIKRDFEVVFRNENSNIVSYSEDVKLRRYNIDWIEGVIQCYKNKEFDRAELLLKTEYENGNKSPDILYHTAYTYYQQGRYFDSMDVLNSIDIKEAEDIRREVLEDNLLYLKGKLLLELKRYDEATKVYEKLVSRNPDDLNYRYKLACAYGLNNEQEKAIGILEEINRQTPGMLYIVKKLGHAYDQRKDFKKARAYFNYAMRLDPNDRLIRSRLEEYNKYLSYLGY